MQSLTEQSDLAAECVQVSCMRSFKRVLADLMHWDGMELAILP